MPLGSNLTPHPNTANPVTDRKISQIFPNSDPGAGIELDKGVEA